MIKREESRHDFAFMAGVVIGAVAGALGTLAFAPRAGVETREKWRARMDEMQTESLKARASSLREVAASQSERLREAASSGSAGSVVESTRARVTDLVDRSPLPVTLGGQQQADMTPDQAADSLAAVAEDAQERLRAEAAAAEDGADQLIDEAAARAEEAADEVRDERPDRPHEG